MEFRKAVKTDIERIMEIIKDAQEYFKGENIDQWQGDYPNRENIKEDIQNGYGYVLSKENTIVAIVALVFDGEETYNSIYNGSWLSDGKYATIHRMAVDTSYKGIGIASIVLKEIDKICLKRGMRSIKVDTHEENLSMEKFLRENGFYYCGIIYLKDGSKRMAFEKV